MDLLGVDGPALDERARPQPRATGVAPVKMGMCWSCREWRGLASWDHDVGHHVGVVFAGRTTGHAPAGPGLPAS